MEKGLKILIATIVILIIIFLYYFFNHRMMVNLDNNATTDPHPAVVRAMTAAANYGNASSFYADEAKQVLENLRAATLRSLQLCPRKYKCIITSGASESNNLILRGFIGKCYVSAMEHKTSLDCAEQIGAEIIPGNPQCDDWGIAANGVSIVNLSDETGGNQFAANENAWGEFGINMGNKTIGASGNRENINVGSENINMGNQENINIGNQENMLANILVSVMTVNNETGSLNPIARISRKLKTRGAIIHSDIVQFYGKFDADNPRHREIINSIDCFSISFHKIHGPVGVGALIVPRSLYLRPQICGTQNGGERGGTENIMACAGALAAISITLSGRRRKNFAMHNKLAYLIRTVAATCDMVPFDTFRGKSDRHAYEITQRLFRTNYAAVPLSDNSSFNTLLVAFVKTGKNTNDFRFCNIKFREMMTECGIKISIGSACATGQKGASHVLHELQAPFIIRAGVVRLSLSDYTTYAEIDYFGRMLRKIMG